MSLLHHDARSEALAQLSCFRGEFYSCLTARSDALFELAEAVLCGDGPVRSLAELSLVGEHRRGHGGLYAALARGRIDAGRLRRALAEVPLPRAADGRLVLAIDITCWLRPDAHTSPQRILCHTYGRGKDQHIPVPGWPYSIICALEPGRSSWTAPLDAVRLTPGDDTATVTARQLRDLLQRLITAGQWQTGDPDILIVADAGYDAPRLGFLLKDQPVQVPARMRSDRVLRRAAPPRLPPHPRPASPTRRRVRLRAARHLGHPGHRNRHRHTPLRPSHRPLMEPAPPQADPPLLLGSRRRHPPDRRRNSDPPGHRPPAQPRNTQAGLAVVVRHRCHTGGRRPSLAGIPATLRHRTHLPPVQADPRLDLPEDPHPRGGGPVDLADPRRLHPTAARPPAGSRPASALGETNPAGQAHPRPSPPRLSAHPPTSRLSGPSTETLPPRPRTATGPKEHPAHTPPRRAHTAQNTVGEPANEEVNHPTTPPHGLKIKLGRASKVPGEDDGESICDPE
ncbi:DDE superfamily endonuclease [Streptomyces sp. Ag82_O1-15]|nr:DDE superfamily endonuclease [Streptomyces sp. Ag82_O1-15]